MKQRLVEAFKAMKIYKDQDEKDYDYGTTVGWLVVEVREGEFWKLEFDEDSYGDGDLFSWKRVEPRPVQKVEYV